MLKSPPLNHKAKLACDASQEAPLARYELRGNPGESYQEEDAGIFTAAAILHFINTYYEPGRHLELLRRLNEALPSHAHP